LEAFNALVQSPLLQLLAPLLGGAALLAFFWWRAGSIRSVLDRVWHLLAGSTDVNDPILKEVLMNSRELERFRFTYRIRVDSLDDVHKLHAWSQKHRLDIATLSKAREWVDVTRPELIKEPPKHYVQWRVGMALSLLALVYVLGALLLPSGALLHMKASGTYFRMQESSFQHPLWLWSVSSSDCKTNVAEVERTTGFTPEEAELICGMLLDGKAKSLIDDNETVQRSMFVGAFVLLALWSALFLWQTGGAQAAIDLRRRMAGADQTAKEEGVEP
jgi:hypothetical protein